MNEPETITIQTDLSDEVFVDVHLHHTDAFVEGFCLSYREAQELYEGLKKVLGHE